MSSMKMAFRSLNRRRTRTALTISGIVVGVAMILVLLSLAAGTSTATGRLIRTLSGADITVVNSTIPAGRGGFVAGAGGLRALFGNTATLNQSLVDQIGNLSGVYAVSPQLSTTGSVDGRSVFIYGIDPSSYSNVTGGLNLVSGSSLSNQANQIVLGQSLSQILNVGIGSQISIGSNSSTTTNYTVVGIYSAPNAFLERGGYVELSSAQAMNNEQGKVSEILVKADYPNEVTQIASTISSEISGVRTVTPSSFTQSASTLSNTLTSFFTVIGLVALLAGGFGVINTMMMSAGERTREIGTLRAIGAKKSQVLKIFISEAFLIGVIGALVGVIIGIAVSFAIPLFTGSSAGFGRGLLSGALSPVLTPYNLGLSFALGTLVGLLAGIYPAWHASNMDPVEALRHV